jgi:secretion/DNA translocation related CpaE-like protein
MPTSSDPPDPGHDRGQPAALLLSRDAGLAEAVGRLASSVGVPLEVRAERPAREEWAAAPLVLVGADLADDLPGRLPRRSGVVVVSREPPAGSNDGGLDTPGIWNGALSIGAERVVLLPSGQEWLADALAGSSAGSPGCGVVATVGGCGGAGASVLATAVAANAAVKGRRTLLADLDPWGGGLDLLLGAGDIPGLRWPELGRARGRVSGAMLREALPRIDGLSLLGWDGGPVGTIAAEAAASVAAGATRGFDLVVADLPRGGGSVASAWLGLVDLVLVVVPADVRAVAAASRVVAELDPVVTDLRAVVRRVGGRSASPEYVADSLGLPLFAELRPEPGLEAALARGEPPGLRERGPLARCSARVLDAVDRLERSP